MARAAVKAKQQQRAAAQPAKRSGRPQRPQRRGRRGGGGGNPNQQLFFARMRRHAKWMYVLLAVLFALTFAFAGVGSGTSGLDQLFSGITLFHHGGLTVGKAEKEIRDHPKDPQGYRDLATAYEAKQANALAISALQEYTSRKKDAKALGELAGLQLSQATDYQNQYANAYAAQQAAAPSTSFLPTGTLGQAIGTSPIEDALSSGTTTAITDAYQSLTFAYDGAISTYKQLAKLRPKDASVQIQLAGAAQNGVAATGSSAFAAEAVAAYKQYLKLNPASGNTAQIKQLIKQLSPTTTTSSGSGK